VIVPRIVLLALGVAAACTPVVARSTTPLRGAPAASAMTFVGHTGQRWLEDFGVREGRCDKAAVGAALGGAADALLRVQKTDGLPVAIVLGTPIGALISARIGRDFDEADRACIGHALELARSGRAVHWTAGVAHYSLTPGKAGGKACRSYTLRGEASGRSEVTRGAACRRDDGAWVPRG
jgi:surface antigen